MIKFKDILKESDLGLTYKKGKTVVVTHKKSGKEIVIIDKPNVRKEYEKIGYYTEGTIKEGLKRFKVYVSGESEPLVLMGKDIKDVKELAHQMIQNSSVRIKKVVKEGKLNEVDFDKVRLPAVVDKWVVKLVDSVKSANLNRIKRSALLYKVIDAMGMEPGTLMQDIQKIKKELK